MAGNDQVGAFGITYAELLTAKVVEGVAGFPDVGEAERVAMLELIAAKLTQVARFAEADHASG